MNNIEFVQTAILVTTLGNIAEEQLDSGVSSDIVIECIAVVLAAVICQKHHIRVKDTIPVTEQIIEAATKIAIDNKIVPSNN